MKRIASTLELVEAESARVVASLEEANTSARASEKGHQSLARQLAEAQESLHGSAARVRATEEKTAQLEAQLPQFLIRWMHNLRADTKRYRAG